GLLFSSYAEHLCDDMETLASCYKIINQNPLGSAAGYGSAFPIDRTETTSLLGFETLNYNSINAQYARGKSEFIMASSFASIALSLNKIASDMITFASQNYSFITLGEEISTGSSIMPHKRNPDVFELIRAKSNQLISIPNQVAMLLTNMQSGYHRDMQILKEIIFPAFNNLKDCIKMMCFSFEKIKINPNVMQDTRYRNAYTVEAMQDMVLKGTPYRDAYHVIASSVKSNTFKYEGKLEHVHEGSIGNLCLEEIEEKFAMKINMINEMKVKNAIKSLLSDFD
ncbi:MAG: lyase family protein, partial [Bacteroidota bacterium]